MSALCGTQARRITPELKGVFFLADVGICSKTSIKAVLAQERRSVAAVGRPRFAKKFRVLHIDQSDSLQWPPSAPPVPVA
jgi:hypothetical protein